VGIMFNEKDVSIERTKGKGPGGQHRNKTESMIKATHLPTGLTIAVDGRKQHTNKREALKLLEEKVIQYYQQQKADKKKKVRDNKIKERDIIRTYDYKKGVVKDLRTGKTASIKNVMLKGRLDLLR